MKWTEPDLRLDVLQPVAVALGRVFPAGMKKQVTFSESRTVHRLGHDGALPRAGGADQSKTALEDVNMTATNSFKSSAAKCEPQHEEATIRIPRTMSAAPYLQQAALTPAQKEFLYTIAASHSPAHVRSLISRHYMNVLHRCVRTGKHPERDDFVVAPLENKREKLQTKTQSEAPPTSKLKGKGTLNAARSKKPPTPNRRSRSLNSSPNFKRTKKRAMASPRKKSPTRARTKLQDHVDDDDDDDDEEEEDYSLDSLSDCLSSLSMTEWDDDIFLDI